MARHLALASLLLVALLLAACARDAPEEVAGTDGADGKDGAGDAWTDIVWQWTTLTERHGAEPTVTEVPDPASFTIVFRADGTFTGQADCNQIAGSYAAGSDFTITLGPATTAYCGEDSLDQRYLELLGQIVAGGPDGGGGFALETAGGADRMEFQDGGAAPAAE